MGRAKFGVRKGQVAFLAALGVGDAGKMRVEVYGPVIAEALGKGVQQGGVVRGGGGPGKLHALTAGVQVPEINAGGNALVYRLPQEPE